MIRLFSFLFAFNAIILSSASNAALFGPNSYEECMSDGKVGRTNAETRNLHLKCRQQFPVLVNLYKKNKSDLVCMLSNGDELLIKVDKKNIYVNKSLSKFIMRTNQYLVIKDLNAAETTDDKRLLNAVWKIDMLEGLISAKFSYADTDEEVFFRNSNGECSENKY